MSWYKIANKDNFHTWLAQRLVKETEGYKWFKSQIYPGTTFEMKDIQLVEDWVNETNSDFENLSLYEAIKAAKIHYENKKLPLKLNLKDINKHNLMIALLDAYNHLSIYDEQVLTDSIVIKFIQSLYPDVSKLQIQNVFNYVVTVEYDVIKNEKLEKRTARLVTKDGKYFSISEIQKMNWYKTAQAWQATVDYLEEERDERQKSKVVPKDNDAMLLYETVRDMGLRYNEVFEISEAKRLTSSNAVKPIYFINVIRKNPRQFPNISKMSDEGLAKIWKATYVFHWSTWNTLSYILEHNLKLEKKL